MHWGRGCASPSCRPCKRCRAFPSPHVSQFSLPEESTGGLVFPSIQWQRALLKLPKKSVIRLDWKEINKIQSVMNPTGLCCFSGARGTARMELGCGWADKAECIHQGKALCVMRTQKQFPRKVHKSNGCFKMSDEREVHLCISIINRILTFKITIPAIVLSRRSKHHHFNIKRHIRLFSFFFPFSFQWKTPLAVCSFFPFFFLFQKTKAFRL